MTRLKFLVLYLFCFSVMLQAQEAEMGNYLWPIEGKKAGENILYRPQDYIEDEHNFDNLFITAEKGTNIVSPCDGIVVKVGYTCNPSLTNSISYKVEGSLEAAADSYREDMAKYGIDAKYLSVCIHIQTTDGRIIYIKGLDAEKRRYITGQKVRRGEVLGKIHYCYKKIPQYCIMLSMGTRNGKPTDPMAPFGLKSTFIPPVVQQPKQRLTRVEATADYRQLAASVKEIYPSLEDFMSEAEYETFVEEEIAKIPESITLVDFARLIMNFNRRIHDSHIWFSYGVSTARHKDVKWSPLWFGKVDGKVKVLFTTKKYREYLGREIACINGRQVDTICLELKKYFNLVYDADVQSVNEWELAKRMPDYYYTMVEEAQKDNRTIFTFSDGEELTVQLEDKSIVSKYERINSQTPKTALLYAILSTGNFYSFIENNSTAYIRLKSFSLMDTELEQMLAFIRQIQTNGIENLIIDLRNNGGGHSYVVDKMLEAVMDEPIIHEGGYQKVNALTFSGTLNLGEGSMFNEFKQVEGKKGFYNNNDYESVEKNGVRHDVYRGRIYVLINGMSASASTLFAGIIKRNKRGYIVGRETKTAYHFMNAERFADIQLVNSMFRCHIPIVRLVHDEYVSDEFPYGRGVIPHLTIPLSYEEVTTNNELIYTKTLDLIANGIYLESEANKPSESQLWVAVKVYRIYLIMFFSLLVMLLGYYLLCKFKKHQ